MVSLLRSQHQVAVGGECIIVISNLKCAVHSQNAKLLRVSAKAFDVNQLLLRSEKDDWLWKQRYFSDQYVFFPTLLFFFCFRQYLQQRITSGYWWINLPTLYLFVKVVNLRSIPGKISRRLNLHNSSLLFYNSVRYLTGVG